MNRPSEDISQTYLILSDGPKVDSRSVRAGVCVDSTVGVAQSESLFWTIFDDGGRRWVTSIDVI